MLDLQCAGISNLQTAHYEKTGRPHPALCAEALDLLGQLNTGLLRILGFDRPYHTESIVCQTVLPAPV